MSADSGIAAISGRWTAPVVLAGGLPPRRRNSLALTATGKRDRSNRSRPSREVKNHELVLTCMHEIKPLVAVLHAHALSATSPEMRDTVIELAILVKKRDAYKEAIFMAGGIVPLVKLLDCHVVTDDSTYPLSIARRAAHVLSPLTTVASHRAAIVAAGGINALAKVADPSAREAMKRLRRDEHVRGAIAIAEAAVAAAKPRRCSRCKRPCPSAEGPRTCQLWGCGRPGHKLCGAHMCQEQQLLNRPHEYVQIGACGVLQCSYADGSDMRANLQAQKDCELAELESARRRILATRAERDRRWMEQDCLI